MEVFKILKEVGISGLIDIIFMSVLIYTIIIFLKRTKAAFVLAGIAIISIIYIISRQFNLFLTASVFQQFFAVILIVVVVIFQEELRRFFEQVAVWSLRDRQLGKRKLIRLTRKEVEIIVRASTELAKEKIGALIVIHGKDPILRHLEGGIALNGELSETLIKSIFNPNSPGHDGAIIIDQNKITQFGCHLPLSRDFVKLQRRGTRHAAGLGLSELADALSIIISEEKGTITVTRNGEMYQVNDPEKLNLILERFYREISPITEARPWYDYFRRNSLEKFFAFAISILLWFVLVHESRLVYKNFTIPVQYTELPSSLNLKEIEPQDVRITLSGPRRTFYFFNKEEIKLFIQLFKTYEGVNYINISNSDFMFPRDFSLVNIEPKQIRVTIEANTSETK